MRLAVEDRLSDDLAYPSPFAGGGDDPARFQRKVRTGERPGLEALLQAIHQALGQATQQGRVEVNALGQGAAFRI